MATIINSNDCTLTIDSVDYTCQITDASLSSSESGASTFSTLCGDFGSAGGTSWSLSISFAYDSGAANSLFDALWDNDGSTAAFLLSAAASQPGSTFAGEVTLVATGMQISAGQVVTCDVELPCTAKPTRATLTRSAPAATTTK
jgi:hypothetical protein